MRKLILLIFMLLIVHSVFALDCQYTEEEKYTKLINAFYENGTELNYNALEAKDFIDGHKNFYCYYPEFKVYNNYNQDINVTIKYLFKGQLDSQQSVIAPQGYAQIKNGACGESGLDVNSVQFEINSPSTLESKRENRDFETTVCKKCPTGSDFTCINDGQPVDSDEKCGSGSRNINGICVCSHCPRYVLNDSIPSVELGENCQNSPSDCACEAYETCEKGSCIADPNTLNPPNDTIYCPNVSAFRKINVKSQGEPCDCGFECVEHYKNCDLKKCQPEPNNPPEGQKYCPEINSFKPISAMDLGQPCNCDFECKSNVCYNNACQELMAPKLTCPSGTSVKKGDELSCNLVARNTLLNKDVNATFVLDAGNGLAFSESLGCQNIKGSQCIGTYTIADLSNEGVEVKLSCLSGGNSKVSGTVVFPYKSVQITEIVDDLELYCYFCGNKIIDPGETKENCCIDVGVANYSFLNPRNEECRNGVFARVLNLPLVSIIAIAVILIVVICAMKFLKGLTKLSEAKQKEIAKKIEHITLQVQKKEKEIKIDEKLMEKLQKEKATEEEINIVKERTDKSIKELKELQEKENHEKEKLKKDRLTPFKNKQGYKVILTDKGYEQFAENPKYPDEEGKLFHTWYAKKFIYYPNRHKYPLPWYEYEVHHKDEDRRNNELHNLELLTKEEHKRRHGL